MKDRFLSLLGLSYRAGKAVLGFDPTQAALSKNKVEMIIITHDISAHTREKIERLARQKKVPIIEAPDRRKLSKALGRDNLAVLGITGKEFAKALKESFSSADR